MKKNHYIAIALMLALMLVVACGKSEKERQAERHAAAQKVIADEEAAFKVGVTPTIDCLPLFLMKDSMLYDSTKIDLRLKRYNAHLDIDTALVGGSLQAAATEMVRAMELRRMHGTRLRAVAVTPLQWTLVGDKKNKRTTLKSLGNNMIAMTRFSATDWLSEQARKKAKVDTLVIFSVQMNDILLRAHMLADDEMDAAWLPEPQATAAIMAGNVALMNSADEGRHFGLIVYREPSAKESDRREAQLAQFKAAYNKAVELINRRGLKYYSALIKKYTGADDKTIARLPKITFTPCGAPQRSDVLAAEKIRFQKHTPKVTIK